MSTLLHYFRGSGYKRLAKGFTLIELMVAVSIIVLITTVVLMRHDRFNSATLLRSLAYSVALSVRQAQAYGTSVRETESGSGLFAPSYAVYFKAGSPTTYYLAADRLPADEPDGVISTDGSEDVSPSPYVIRSGYRLRLFCAYTNSGAAHCHDYDGGANVIDELAIRFTRPNPDAQFVTDVSPLPAYVRACIQLASPTGDSRTVRIGITGQISVSGAGATCN